MIRYVPSTAAQTLSESLWDLARPPGVSTGEATAFMFPWIDDLQTPAKRWLVVDTTFAIPVHPEAVLDGIADVLQPWIDGGYLPADTNTELAVFVESKRGQNLTVYDAFPQFFKDQSKTYAEMVAAGFLTEGGMS